MKLQKDGKTATIARDELEVLVKHVLELEKLVAVLQRQDAAGSLSPELKRPWASLSKLLETEEAKAAGAQATVRSRKVRCCILRNAPLADVVDCRETNTTYAFALARCVAAAIAGGFDATLVAGKCSAVSGCA